MSKIKKYWPIFIIVGLLLIIISLKKSPNKTTTMQSTISPQIIYFDTLEVKNKWLTLDEIPDEGEKFIFTVFDTNATLLWQYEGEYGRKEIPLYKRGAKQVGGLRVDGPNETRARAQIKIKKNNKVKVILLVKY